MAASATGIEAGRAYLKLLLDDTDAIAAMTKFERRAQVTGQILTSLGARLGALSAGLSAPFIAAIRIASSAQETLQKFEQTFKEQSKAAQDFANTYSGALTTAQRVTQNTLSDIYNQFLGLGAGRDVALEYAKALTQAAADFESFQNLPQGDSIRRISSGLAGETEPLRRFGIDVSDDALDRRFKAKGIVGGSSNASFLDKGLERAQVILETMGRQDILGDVERTAGQAENQIRAFRRALEETAVQIGSSFLPIIESTTPTIVAIVEAIGDFAAANPLLVTSLGGAAVTVTAVSAAAIVLGLTLTNVGVIVGVVSGALQKLGLAGVESGVGATAAAAGANQATAANQAWGASTTIVIGKIYETIAANYAQATSWYALGAATDAATAAQARYLALSLAGGGGAALLGGPAQKLLPGSGVDPRTIVSITTLGVKTNDATKAAWSLSGALKAVGAALAAQFPTVILLGTQVKAVFLSLGTAIAAVARVAVGLFVASMTPLAGVLTIVAAAAGYLAYEMWLTSKAEDAASESAKKAAAALDRLREAIEESLGGPDAEDVAKRIDNAAAAAQRYGDVLASVAEERRQLNALEAAGRGDSDEANNLRSRINAEERALPDLREQARQTAAIADPATQSREALAALEVAIKKYGEAMKVLQDDPSRGGSSLATVRAANNKISERFKLGDPAIQVLTTALTDEVIGGTAKDPQARLAELRQQIKGFQDFYDNLRGSSDKTIADYANQQFERFFKLREEAETAIPSAIGGRDKPLIPGTEDGDNALKREATKRADAEAEALSRARSSQNDLIEDDLQRRLAEIQQEREELLAGATKDGDSPVAVNAINQQFDNEAELARRDAAKRTADQTRALQIETELSEIAANSGLSDLVKEAKSLDLREEAALADPNLNDQQRGLVQRDFAAKRELLIQEEAAERERTERQRRDRRRRLDISDVFTGSIATGLAIGPPVGLEQQQLNEQKRAAGFLEEIRNEIVNNQGGIPGI
jgi:hypothetical protein